MSMFKFLIILYLLCLTAALADGAATRGSKLPSSSNSTANKNASPVDPKRECGELGSRSECGQNPKCRWCRSESLDDMCFSKSEAWRLPSQVFSCRF